MSEEAELARLPTGVVPLHEPIDVAVLERACEDVGRPLVALDTSGVQDKPEFMAAIASAMRFPDWFGRNWDALADCLRDVPAETIVLWDGWTDLALSAPRVCELAIELFGESPLTVLLANAPEPR